MTQANTSADLAPCRFNGRDCAQCADPALMRCEEYYAMPAPSLDVELFAGDSPHRIEGWRWLGRIEGGGDVWVRDTTGDKNDCS